MYVLCVPSSWQPVGKIVINDRQRSKQVLFGHNRQIDMFYWTNLVEIFFEYSLKIHEYT